MKYIFISALVFFLFSPVQAQAAEHYVRDGTGLTTNCGADWNTACDTLPTNLNRGDTYYIADGSYGSYRFDDPESGSQYITIKKATESDHGTSTGWQSNYGDGEAVVTAPLRFESSYYIFDGQTRSSDWKSDYGIRITTNTDTHGIRNGQWDDASHIIIRNVMIDGNEILDNGFYILSSGATNWTIQNCAIIDTGRCFFLIRNFNDVVIENNYFARSHHNLAAHSQGISASGDSGGCNRFVVRNNHFVDSGGTGTITINGNDWDIYNNLFYFTPANPRAITTNGVIGTWDGYSPRNHKIYGNTFANYIGINNGVHYTSSSSGMEVYNNIWYNCEQVSFHNAAHNYNYFINSNHDSESNMQTGSTSPFVDSSNYNFRLRAETNPGFSLPYPYNLDLEGNTRGADGIWDRGAFEYSDTGCSCDPWADGSCQAGSCGVGQREQTTTCTPSGCGPETRCVTDSACDIACSSDQDCDDSNPCTDDVCQDPGLITSNCQNTPNIEQCDDSDPCTISDTCSSGSCSGTPITQCSMVSDSCCPSGCTEETDSDCTGVCKDILALYNLDGNAQDSSGNNFHGTISGAVSVQSYPGFGQTYSFDGIDDYIDLSNIDTPGPNLTFSIWINPNSYAYLSTFDAIFLAKSSGSDDQDFNWVIGAQNLGTGPFILFGLKTESETSYLTAPLGIEANEWSHVAATYDGTEMKLFLNGTEVGTLPKSGSPEINPSLESFIGRNPNGFAPYGGLIDDVAIFSRALSFSEIQQIYTSGQPLSCQTKIIYHVTDLDSSCTIELDEVNSFIELWYEDSTENPMSTLMESLAYYYSPGYC